MPDGFDCDLASDEILIARQIDLAHRTAPETFFELVS